MEWIKGISVAEQGTVIATGEKDIAKSVDGIEVLPTRLLVLKFDWFFGRES